MDSLEWQMGGHVIMPDQWTFYYTRLVALLLWQTSGPFIMTD